MTFSHVRITLYTVCLRNWYSILGTLYIVSAVLQYYMVLALWRRGLIFV